MENKGNEAVLTFSQYSIQIQEIQRFKTCWQCNKIQKISSKKLENWKSSQIAKSFKIFADFWRLKNSFRARCTYLNLWESNTFKFQQLWLNEGKVWHQNFLYFCSNWRQAEKCWRKLWKKMLCLKFSPSPSPWFYSGGVKWMGPLDNIGRNTSTTLRNLRQTQHTLLCWLISSENSLSFIFLAALLLAL